MEYNLKYMDKEGNIIFGKRLKHVRRIKLQGGREFGCTYMSHHFDYIGNMNYETWPKPRSTHVFVRNINGFKVRVK